MTNRPYLIGIVGGSGSGKSTLLRQIRQTYSIKEVCTLNMDDYYFPREQQLIDSKGIRNFDLPSALDAQRFVADLTGLMQGQPLQIQEYTFNNALKSPEAKVFTPAPVLVLEGLFLFCYPDLESLFDYRVFVEARESIRLIRRIRRDRTERNYPLEDVLYRFEHHVLPSYDQHISPFREKADLVIYSHENEFEGLDRLHDQILAHIPQV